jgi:hypothetical protein
MYAMNLVISCLFFLQFYSKIQLTVRFVLEHTVRGLAMPLAAANEITIFLVVLQTTNTKLNAYF